MFGTIGQKLRVLVSPGPVKRTRYSALALLLLLLLILLGLGAREPISKRLLPTYDTANGIAMHISGKMGCDERYGEDYIHTLSKTQSEHCTLDSGSQFDCFTHTTDSFCVGSPAIFDTHAQRFQLDCTEEKNNPTMRLDHLPPYMYDTGPKYTLREHVVFIGHSIHGRPPSRYFFLVKREETVRNLWHSLMEIMALGLTIDVLRETINVKTKQPFLDDVIIQRSKVVFLDEQDDGPFMELWNMYAGNGTMRLADMNTSGTSEELVAIVLPLPGGSNPFWDGDWAEIACGQSSLLQRFTSQILQYYGILGLPINTLAPLVITLIDRRDNRRLFNDDQLLAALSSRFSDAIVQTVDFASLPFRDQLIVARSTKVLIGIHGAGLTHAMFLPPGSTIVEIQPPDLPAHKGFENLAKFRGCGYIRCPSRSARLSSERRDWHFDDVIVEETMCVDLLEAAL